MNLLRSAIMKIVIIAVLAILFVVISACGNKEKRHNINLLSNLKMLSKKQKELQCHG